MGGGQVIFQLKMIAQPIHKNSEKRIFLIKTRTDHFTGDMIMNHNFQLGLVKNVHATCTCNPCIRGRP
jgi:hypothetical protein